MLQRCKVRSFTKGYWNVWEPETAALNPTWRPRGLSKPVISRVIIGLAPLRALITLLVTYLLSSLGLQVNSEPKMKLDNLLWHLGGSTGDFSELLASSGAHLEILRFLGVM